MAYDTLASEEIISTTVASLTERGFIPHVVNTKDDALAFIKSQIPQGASVMNGASKTLEQIGFIEYLKSGAHGWNNLHEAIINEKDKEKQAVLRRQSVLSDYYLGSVHALAQTGEIVIASNTGSQLPHIVFTSPRIIFVVGVQKITQSLSDAMNRLTQYVVPLEDDRMKKAYGVGTMVSKILTLQHENPMMGREVYVVLVRESLGF